VRLLGKSPSGQLKRSLDQRLCIKVGDLSLEQAQLSDHVGEL